MNCGTVQQWMDEVGLALKYDSEELESSCDVVGDVTFGNSFDFKSECVNGVTSATIIVYMEDNFDPDECKACDVDDLMDMEHLMGLLRAIHLQQHLISG